MTQQDGTAESRTENTRDGGETPVAVDDLVSTHHTISTTAGELSYTATAGRMVLREEVHEDGTFRGHKPKAEVFVTSYVADVADSTRRPVTFAFNGGPGASSTWSGYPAG